jgi:5-(carboxyamino)imidazole ribonucleotide mutase
MPHVSPLRHGVFFSVWLPPAHRAVPQPTSIIDSMDAAEQAGKPLIGVVMGSRSDFSVMQAAVEILREFCIPYEARVVSAHRTPDLLISYAREASARGLRCIIAGAGGAAHLPGMMAAMTVVPVLGVPVAATALQGLDALLSIVQMPRGVPVGTLAIGASGAANAALLAVAMLATTDLELQARLEARRGRITEAVIEEHESMLGGINA